MTAVLDLHNGTLALQSPRGTGLLPSDPKSDLCAPGYLSRQGQSARIEPVKIHQDLVTCPTGIYIWLSSLHLQVIATAAPG